MADLFATGRIVDLILVLMILETVVLAGYHRFTGRGVPTVTLLTNMAAGACLLLALRGALAGAPSSAVAMALAAAFAMHAFDLRARWGLSRAGTSTTQQQSPATLNASPEPRRKRS